MNVAFYGHVRQYNNVKADIDAAIQEVLDSGKFVQGPVLARFEAQAAEYFGKAIARKAGISGVDHSLQLRPPSFVTSKTPRLTWV